MTDSKHQLWSIVIPTLWRSDHTIRLLQELNQSPRVGEVILIDNSPEDCPSILKGISKKLVYLPQKENIYVNPAWNLGVRNAQYDLICICNDDIVFDTDVFHACGQELNRNEQATIVGAHKNSYPRADSKVLRPIHFTHGHWIGKGWGSLLFFSKSHWKNIPNELLIYSGDRYITTKFRNIKSILVEINGDSGVSSQSKEFSPILKRDQKNFDALTNHFERSKFRCTHATSFGRFNAFVYLAHCIKEVAAIALGRNQ